jgi:ubiquinone/menaquinone biosynthesis C-methylase UbiE
VRVKREKKQYNERLLNWRYGLIEKYIETGAQVLDVGAGTGWVAQRLLERKGCDVHLLDVVDCNETSLPLQLYDGKKLPYPAKTFDVALFVFVLHHALNHGELLQEAARVARQKIIIVEDTPANPGERIVQWFWDTILSFEHGFAAPHNYNGIATWREVFTKLDLQLASEETVKPFLPFYYTKAVFMLDLKQSREGRR